MSARVPRLVVMMVRPPVGLVVLLFAALGMASAGRADGVHPLFTTVLVVLGGWFVNATAVNDLTDEPIDRVNLAHARGRPLVSGHASRRQLVVLAVAAAALSLGVAATQSRAMVLVVAAGLAFNLAYSLPPVRLGDRGGLASALLPIGYVVVPFLVGAVSVAPVLTARDLVLLPGLYVAFAGRILLKDFRDVRGDARFGKRTFLLRYGRVDTCRLSGVCWVVGTVLVAVALPAPGHVTAALVAFAACALDGLIRLAAAPNHVAEQVVIGAIAHSGRGQGVVLLAHLTLLDQSAPAGLQPMVVGALTTLFVAGYVTMFAARTRAVALQPW